MTADDPGVSARCERCRKWFPVPSTFDLDLSAEQFTCARCQRLPQQQTLQHPKGDRTQSTQARAVTASILRSIRGKRTPDAA